MIIYKCIVTNDEMFSDIYKITETHDGLFYEVQGKTISRVVGDIDESLLGGNASAEEVQESNESSTESGVDIVLNHKLSETSFDKKSYTTYIKGYMKIVKERLEKDHPERVEAFMKDAPAGVKVILGKFKDYQFFTGESMNPDGTIGLLDYREDGITPYMLFFKDGLEIEKC